MHTSQPHRSWLDHSPGGVRLSPVTDGTERVQSWRLKLDAERARQREALLESERDERDRRLAERAAWLGFAAVLALTALALSALAIAGY
jgi:hypothetical protein